jgi:murein DD-endopeptidase MepM/ murein hydrolase activator NlpD
MDTLAIFFCCCLPLKHLRLNSDYGYRWHPVTGKYAFHAGVDLEAKSDTVYAIFPGKVNIGYNQFLGVNIKINCAGLQAIYGHLSQILTTDSVSAGTPIAISGATGRVTGPHLHLSIKYKDHFINPLAFLYAILKQQNHE